MNYQIFNKSEVSEDRPAIISSNRILSYREFYDEVKITAGRLNLLGVKKGSHQAILSGNNTDFIILLFALWHLQAVPIPMNIRLLDNEIKDLIDHSESEMIFIHSDLRDRISDQRKRIFPFSSDVDSTITDAANIEGSVPGADETALILYTSGTTGRAKGVMLSYSNLLHSAYSADEMIKHIPADRWLASLPFYHIGGISIPVRAFLFGASIVLPDSLKAEDIEVSLEKFNPTLASFVSTTLKQLLLSNVAPNPGLRLVLLGGGPIEDELAIKATEKGWIIAKVYGATETSSLVTSVNINQNPEKSPSAGKPLASNRIYIVDENNNRLAANKSGEVVVSGNSVMKGYWKETALSELKLKSNMYYSGDLGFLDQDGYLYIESRRTDLIVTGGENVNPLEVETALLKFTDIKEVCVFPLSDKKWGQTVAALIVQGSRLLNVKSLKECLKDNLSPFKIPKKIFYTDKLPRTSLGKIKREQIRQMYNK